MGRKQRAKLEKKAKVQSASKPAGSKRYTWVAWVLAVIAVVVVLFGVMVLYVQNNKAHFMKVSVISSCEKLQKDLYQKQAGFTRDDSSRLRALLDTILQVTNQQKKMDERVGAQFLFVLKVMEEILQAGDMQPQELEKMELLVGQAQSLLQGKKAK
jgi:hypothetical protein